MREVQRGWWSALLCWSLQACADEALLGDNRVPVGAGEDAPTVEGGADTERGPLRFDVTVERVVAPTWQYDFVCEDRCGGSADVRVAPDGSIWAALLGKYISVPSVPRVDGAAVDDRLHFIHLDAHGGELGRYTKPIVTSALVEAGSPLLLDGEGQPYVLRWPTTTNEANPSARALRLQEGQIEDQRLPTGFHKDETEYLAGFPDGSFLEFSSDRAVKAALFSASGQKIWQANNLRAVPMQDGNLANDGPLYLSDGAVVFDRLHKSELTDPEGGFGLTVVGPDGQLRWDMKYYFPFGPPYRQLAAGADGGLILAGISSPDRDLGVFVYDWRGAILHSFRGVRVGYHPVGPRALGTDSKGDVYVALVVGERDEPKLSVCKLSSSQGETPARCLGLSLVDLDGGTPNATPLPFLNLRMEVPEPGAVLIALKHVVGADTRTSVVRLDFAAAEAGTPAQ